MSLVPRARRSLIHPGDDLVFVRTRTLPALPCRYDRWRLALHFYTHVSEREVEVLEEEVGGQGSRLLMTLAAQNKALLHGFTTVIAAHGRGSDSCGLPSGAWHGMMEPFLNRIELESKEDTY